jgi:HEAT repeat protein
MQFGAEVIPALEAAFVQEGQHREIRICIARLCGRIGGHEAIALLRQHLRFPDAAVRNHVLSALALCKYRATPEEQPLVAAAIRGEVEDATWALAAIDDLGTAEEAAVLTHGLSHAVAQHRERALLLLSFLYQAEAVLQAKDTLDSDSSEKRASALEVLDTFVAQDLKSLVFPLLDDLTAEARLTSLQAMFPQRRLSATERLQDIILSSPTRSTAWTRTGALFAIGTAHTIACRESTIMALADPDPVVRETAAWSLSEIDSAAYQQQAETLRADPSPMVRRTVARLTAERLAESPGSL